MKASAYTFGDIDARSNRLVQLLAQRGLKPGDRLCVYLANCVELIDLYLACVKLGVIFVPINILYRERELNHILTDAEPAAVVSATEFPSPAPMWNPFHLTREAAAFPDQRPQATLEGDAPAGIIYTSGTTGVSKGAILTHNNMAANALNLLTCWQITSTDRFLLALPLFHVHGLGNGLHCWLISGCRMRLLERFEHQKAAAEFLDFRPTLFFGVPAMYVRLLDLAPEQAREIGAFVRLFVSGSAPLPAADFRRVSRALRPRTTGTLWHERNADEHQQPLCRASGARAASACRCPAFRCDCSIPRAARWPMAKSGEVYLKGPNIFAGYWRRDEATRAAFVDGLFPDRRHRNALARRLLHAVRAQERPDHFRRLQHLSARDRGIPPGTGRRGGSRCGGRPRSRARRSSRWPTW